MAFLYNGVFNMELKEIATQYFTTFSNKDIDGLALMFTDDIVLRDWERSAEGSTDVLAANQAIFDAVDSIEVTPLALYQDLDIVIAEISILINGTDTLLVNDVLTFVDGKISNIRAYRG